MDDAGAVSRDESGGNLLRVLKGIYNRQFSPRESDRQGLSVDVLHNKEVEAILSPDVVEGADVWMIQRGDGTRLALHPLAGEPIGACARRKHLDCHDPIEA